MIEMSVCRTVVMLVVSLLKVIRVHSFFKIFSNLVKARELHRSKIKLYIIFLELQFLTEFILCTNISNSARGKTSYVSFTCYVRTYDYLITIKTYCKISFKYVFFRSLSKVW